MNKIFGIGLHRTGTSSLKKACEILGIKSAHWVEHQEYKLLDSLQKGNHNKELDDFDAFMDIPIPCFYKYLDGKFPDSLFILTIRDNQSWSKSIKTHMGWKMKDAKHLQPETKLQYKHYQGELTIEKCIKIYNDHISDVKEYFKGRSNLLIFNVSEGWTTLCNFLNKKIPSQKFPHANNHKKDKGKIFDANLLPKLNEKIEVQRHKLKSKNDFTHEIFNNESWFENPISHYDHFVSNGHEYLILPHYSIDLNIDYILKEYEFTTIYNNSNLWEQSYIAYRKTLLKDTYKETHDIVICAYFLQNSNIEIKRFADYYKAQGVEKIFLYYNGDITKKLDLPKIANVEYLEWNHAFKHIPKDGIRDFIHNLQIPLYNMFSKKISPHCNWTIFCDLDEYISYPNQTLKNFLNSYQKLEHLYTQHRISVIDFNANKVTYENKTSRFKRGKSILNGKIINPSDTMNVHLSLNANPVKDLLMFHNRDSFKGRCEIEKGSNTSDLFLKI